MYEFFEHTADLGLRIQAPDLDGLFAEAARRSSRLLSRITGTIQPLQRFDVELSADDCEYLLFDWLRELLYRFDTEHMLFGRFDVHVSESGLKGTAWGEPVDVSRHALGHEVKAITYHRLRLERTSDGWLAEAIVDI